MARNLDLHATKGADRVREHTAVDVRQGLDRELIARVRDYAARADSPEGKQGLDARIAELEQEPDIERTLEQNASVLAFCGVALGALHHRRWLIVPAVVTAFLLQHAVQGWCPPMAVFRRLGIRTRQEIDAERYALKLLRGDCAVSPVDGDDNTRAERVLEAVFR